MSLTSRLSNGWEMGMTSLHVLRNNPKLLLFPVFSTLSLLMVLATFFGGIAIVWGLDFGEWTTNADGSPLQYLLLFGYYLVNYFVIVFFNVGLVYSAKRIFEGHEVTLTEGLNFSYSRIGVILQWAVLAATVGVVLKTLQENLGWIGKIIVGLIGMVWSIATYFVVPVLAFENLPPIEAVKRSGAIIKEKWGESLSANIGFGVFFLVGYLVIIAGGFLIGYLVHPLVGVAIGMLAALVLHTVVSAAQTVFLAAAYQHVNNDPYGDFSGEVLDGMFVRK
ncbi:MAG: hypothetical protein IPM82_02275 [Saprospiraceae bacterium]|nr:hypothetical protein [Saprospiraceae bacterium]